MTVQSTEHFPPTPRTLVHNALDCGDHAALASHLMAMYERPLMIYFSATTFRTLGSPREVVASFFADRFSRPEWLHDWREACQKSEIPLRRWLLNALNFFLQEEARRIARDRRTQGTGGVPEAASEASAAEASFEREAARSIVAEALRRTRAASDAAGQSTHYEVFVQHFIDGKPYEVLAPIFGLTESQCAGYVRTTSAKFRRSLAQTLLDEGASTADLDSEITVLLGALRQ